MLCCRYVSVTKGWWLAWNSPTPRRSGAFVLEIVERAQQQTLKEQVTSRIMDIKVHSVACDYTAYCMLSSNAIPYCYYLIDINHQHIH